VRVDGAVVGAIGRGVCLLVGVAPDDSPEDVAAAADKIAALRIFADDEGKMNRSLTEVGGEALVVSQFTLLGSVRKGRRPSFTAAAPPEIAELLVESLAAALEERGVPTAQGRFGAMMEVELTNDGPVTLVLEVSRGRVS
jgi:D-tyrosyl-tRNA(Tyr) deacylase